MDYITYKSQQAAMSDFLKEYHLLLFYAPPLTSIKNRVPRKERICRFCVKRWPHVKFNTEPHIIPRLFGENYGVSDHECDTCNNKFSRYETHLADFLGLVRTFLSVSNDNPVPTFKSPRESLVARISSEYTERKAIKIQDNSHNGIHINTATGENKITYIKNTYIPVNVFKALLKIALTLLPERYLNAYGMMFDFINSEENHPAYVQFAKVLFYTTEYRVSQTCCYLFERTNPFGNQPTHIFKLYFENFIYEFFLPYHIADRGLYEPGTQLATHYCPPILAAPPPEEEDFSLDILDLTSTAQVKNQPGHLVFHLNPKLYHDAKVYDLSTGKAFPFDPAKIVSIQFFRIDDN